MQAFESIQQLVMENISLIEVASFSFTEARDRAAKFLTVQAILASHLKDLEDVKVKASTIEKVTYAQAIAKQDGKNVTENKIKAEADAEYCGSREAIELIDSEFNWTKRHYEVFANAHIMFRQLASEK